MSSSGRYERSGVGTRAPLFAASILGVYVLQLGATLLHVTDEHRAVVPVHHHDAGSPDHDAPSHDDHTASDHLDEVAYRRPQVDCAPVVACVPAPELDAVVRLSTPVALKLVTPTGIEPSPGPPSRAPPAA